MSALLYLLAWAGTLLDAFVGVANAGTVAGLAILAYLLIEFPRQRRYAQVVFLGLVGLGLAGAVTAAHPWLLFLAGWRRGASYAAFFLALTALRDAAETSRLVRRCGAHLVAQPPGLRYAALTGGGYVFGVILSYGAIDLLGAMVARADPLTSAAGSEAAWRLRARRMLMAIYRGFAVMNCWSPLNIMTAVVSTAVPAAPMRLLLPFAFVVSLGLLAVGWLEDRLHASWRRLPGGGRPGTEERWAIHLGVIGLVALVMLLSEAVSGLAGVSLVAAVTVVVPLVGLGWILIQVRPLARRGSTELAARRVVATLGRRFGRFVARIPTFRGEAMVLAASGFMGASLGGALPTYGFARAIGVLPAAIVPLLVPVLLVATGQLGLNPVGVVALIGAALPDPMALGVPPAVLAFACMLGWGVGVGVTPMSAGAMTTARWAEASPWTVSTVWNGPFTAAATVASWVAILGLWAMLPFIVP
jgi:hypothetical protein